MKLTRWIQMLAFATLTALIYIHLQMEIFSLAYQGKVKEQRIQALKEDNGTLTSKILRLKSASHLGTQMLDKQSRLKFMGQEQIMQIATRGADSRGKIAPTSEPKARHQFAGLFSLLTPQAEAKVVDRVGLAP